MNSLYYHKCNDCLTPFSSTERHIDLCDCDGAVTFMGIVQGENYVQTGNRPACDRRCTHACGPSCDCACNGANHGTGRVVMTVIKEGKVKVVDPSKDIHDDMVRGYKYRELKDKAEGIYKAKFGALPSYAYNARVVRRELDKALSLRVYERRHKALIDFVLKYIG